MDDFDPVERLQHQINQDKKTITAQKEQISLLRKQNESLSQELEEKIKRLNILEQECAKKIAAVEDEWKSKYEALRSSSEKASQAQVDELQNVLKISDEKLKENAQQIKELNSLVAELEKEKASLKISVEKLESRCQIVSGAVVPTEEECDYQSDSERDLELSKVKVEEVTEGEAKAEGPDPGIKGFRFPPFWLALLNDDRSMLELKLETQILSKGCIDKLIRKESIEDCIVQILVLELIPNQSRVERYRLQIYDGVKCCPFVIILSLELNSKVKNAELQTYDVIKVKKYVLCEMNAGQTFLCIKEVQVLKLKPKIH